jgi:hypothetical protein
MCRLCMLWCGGTFVGYDDPGVILLYYINRLCVTRIARLLCGVVE